MTSRLLILAAAILFSTGGAAIKATSLSGWQVASFRSAFAGLALLVLMRGWAARWSPRALAVGTVYAATMISYVVANKLTTAANTIFLQSTAPLHLLWLGPWLLAERARATDLALTGLIATGMVLFFVGNEPAFVTAPDPLRGNTIAVASGFFWALTLLGLRWISSEGTGAGPNIAAQAVILGNVIAFAVCLPLALPVSESHPADWALVGYLGVFQIGLAYVCMTRGLRRVPALEASLLLLLEPVMNALWAWLVHAERPGPWSLAGCAIILASTVYRTLSPMLSAGLRGTPENSTDEVSCSRSSERNPR